MIDAIAYVLAGAEIAVLLCLALWALGSLAADLGRLAVSQWRRRRAVRALRRALATVDCPWCSPAYRWGSGTTARDCTCTRQCPAPDCQLAVEAADA